MPGTLRLGKGGKKRKRSGVVFHMGVTENNFHTSADIGDLNWLGYEPYSVTAHPWMRLDECERSQSYVPFFPRVSLHGFLPCPALPP